MGKALVTIKVKMELDNHDVVTGEQSFTIDDTLQEKYDWNLEQIWLMNLQRTAGKAFQEASNQKYRNG